MLPDYVKLLFLIITVIGVSITLSECEELNTDADYVSEIEDTSSGPEIIFRRRRPTSSSANRPTSAANRPTRPTSAANRPTRPTSRWPTKATTPHFPPTTRPTSRSTTTTKRITIKPTKTKPPIMKWKMPEARYAALFGGLSGAAVGTYLGHQIAKIVWEANVPAYSVRHHWHQQGYAMSTDPDIEASSITACSKNVNFCVPDTEPMCFLNGRVYCVVPEFQTQQCLNSTVGACVTSTLKLPCESRWSFGCFFTGYKYEQVSIPCLRYIRVIYKGRLTSQNRQFFIPSSYTGKPGANNTCKCNITHSQPINKLGVMCTKVNVSDTEKILCSGLNLSNNTAITLNSALNIANSRNVSCLPNLAVAGSVTNIFDAHKMSTLVRCEMLNDTNTIGMICGHLGNLTNKNISIPITPNIVSLSCAMENSTLAFGKLSAVNTTTDTRNTVCLCNSTLIANNVTSQYNKTAKGNARRNYVYSVRYCVSVAAVPMKLYDNRAYIRHLYFDTDERQQVTNKANQILAAIAHYIWF